MYRESFAGGLTKAAVRALPDVRFGSLADMATLFGDIRFTPESGHSLVVLLNVRLPRGSDIWLRSKFRSCWTVFIRALYLTAKAG